jgi:DNA-directed RNA polymerase subunit beta
MNDTADNVIIKISNRLFLDKIEKDYKKIADELNNALVDKMYRLLKDKTANNIINNYNEEVLPKGVKFTQKVYLKSWYMEQINIGGTSV